MKDIVRHFEQISKDKGWIYAYGTMQALNLKMNLPNNFDTDGNDTTAEQIYMLAEPTTRRYNMTNTATGNLTNITYTGALMIVMKSNLASPYFSEQNTQASTYEDDIKKSKYVLHVEPLLKELPSMIKYLTCQELSIINFEVVDWIDYLDENRDGILIRYTLQDEFR